MKTEFTPHSFRFSNKQMGKLTVDVWKDNTFYFYTDEASDDYLDAILKYFKDKKDEALKKSGGTLNPLQISVLSGILICDELFKERKKNIINGAGANAAEDEKIKKRIEELIKMLDSISGNSNV